MKKHLMVLPSSHWPVRHQEQRISRFPCHYFHLRHTEQSKPGESEDDYTFSERMSYVGQILAARKINQNLSLQLMPSVINRNVDGTEPDLLWSAGAGGSVKITRRISLNAEYYYCFNRGTYNNSDVYNPLSIGFDIENERSCVSADIYKLGGYDRKGIYWRNNRKLG